MKKYLFSIILVFCLSLSAMGQTQIAIIPFTGLIEKEGSQLADAISAEIRKLGAYNVVPRTSAITSIAKDRTAQRNGLTDTEVLATLGKGANAEFVISGHVLKMGDSQMAFVSIVDANTLQQVYGDYIAYAEFAALIAYMPKMTKILIDSINTNYKNSPVLAILQFDAEDKNHQSDRELLMPILVAQMASSGKYSVVVRTATIERFMKENRIQSKAFTDRGQVARIGKAVGADYVLFGSFSKLLSSDYIESYIVDVNKSALLDSSEKRYRNLVEGLQMVSSISSYLTGVKSQNGHMATEVPEKPAPQTPVVQPAKPVVIPTTPTVKPLQPHTPTQETSKQLPDISIREALKKYEGKTGILAIADGLKSGVNTLISGYFEGASRRIPPIMIASMYGYTDLVIALIQEGANLDIAVNEKTSLMWAVEKKHKDIMDILLSQGADVSIDNCAVLLYAIRQNDKYAVEQLLEYGVDIERVKLGTRAFSGKLSALLHACDVNNIDIDILKMLLAAGSNVNDVNTYNRTALAIIINKDANTDALRKVKMQKVQLLIDAGTNINLADGDGRTLLMWAVGYTSTQYDLDLVNLLLENNALLNMQDRGKNTALDYLNKKSRSTIRDRMIEILENTGGFYGYEL